MKEKPSPGEILRQRLNLERSREKVLDRFMQQVPGFPKSLNSFPLRLERLDKAMAACKKRNLSPDQRIHWMSILATGLFADTQQIADLLKASVSQARKAAGRKGLIRQEKNPDKKRTKAKKTLQWGEMPEICD